MSRPDLSVARAHELLDVLTLYNDGEHVPHLVELISGIMDGSIDPNQVRKDLYARTPDFETHLAAYVERLRAA